MNFTSKKDTKMPKGFSYINHEKRSRLKLTVNEYIFADYLEQCLKTDIKINTESLVKMMGPDVIEKPVETLDSLKFKGIINYTKINGIFNVEMTNVWGLVSKKDELFEKIWKILRNKGTKEKARKNFVKTIRVVPYETLEKAALKLVSETPDVTFQMSGHNFLDPSIKAWEDILAKKAEEPVNKIAVPDGRKETR